MVDNMINPVFMHRPAQRNMSLKRRAGRAASRGRWLFPTRLSKIAGLTLSMIEATYYPKDWNVKYEEDINKCINKSIAQNDYYCYV